ncbi:MAG: hypothetical protein ABW185_01480 [Sedimenticola sp.]
MKPITKTLMATALCLLTATPVYAGYSYGNQNNSLFNRTIDQHNKIERGIEKGRLTEKEGRTLYKQQQKFFRTAAKFRKDGQVSRKEQRLLHKMLDRNEARIKAMKQDHRSYRSNFSHNYDTNRTKSSVRWW